MTKMTQMKDRKRFKRKLSLSHINLVSRKKQMEHEILPNSFGVFIYLDMGRMRIFVSLKFCINVLTELNETYPIDL